MTGLLPDISDVQEQLDAAERDARLLVKGLDEERGCQLGEAGSWSVAQCLDHVAIANRVYLRAMEQSAIRARVAGRMRRRPALPGILGRWFVSTMEPPVRASFKMKAPQRIRPGTSPSLAEAVARFLGSQQEIRDYLEMNADLDLAAIRFPNPLVPGVRFSLATGLYVLTAHERRHLWQAWGMRRAAEDKRSLVDSSTHTK